MNKLYLIIISCIVLNVAKAQSLDDIADMINGKKMENARAAIENYLNDPKNAAKPDGWYFKGYIYNTLSYENNMNTQQKFNYKKTSFEAFRKNQQLDPKDVRMTLEQFQSYLGLYTGFYDLGATQFNDRQYTDAYNSFLKAQEVEDYILAKNYKYKDVVLTKLDTGLTLNIATSALQAKDEVNAIKYYKKLSDANVSGSTYKEVYEYLGNYYAENDAATFQTFIVKARSLYPGDEYWNDLEIQVVRKSGDKNALYAKYDQLVKEYPANFMIAYNYAVELYNEMYTGDAKNITDEKKLKLTNVIKAAMANDKGKDATLLLSNHIFNQAADLANQASLLRGNKPEDVKKRKELNSASVKMMDEYIPYAEQVTKWMEEKTDLKSGQKANLKGIYNNLSDAYAAKGDAQRADGYRRKADAVKF